MKKIYLYTAWCEQGLSYDAKVIEKIAKDLNIQVIITYHKKRKIVWDCEFTPIKDIRNIIQKNDIFFCFERFPRNYIQAISENCSNLYLMINYEYFEKSELKFYKLFQKIFCKSKIAYESCQSLGLKSLKYMQWILYDFPILSESKSITDDKIQVLFNGGTGGYKDRRNFGAVTELIKNYNDNDVYFTIKFTENIRRWSKAILSKNWKYLKNDSRVTIIKENMSRAEYIKFLKGFDLNLAPSKYEGFGLTLLEAMYMRIPTITTDASPMNEIIVDNFSGRCVKAFRIGQRRSQPIYDVYPDLFLQAFVEIVKNPDKLMKMKDNCVLKIKEKREDFINYFNKLFSNE